MTSTAAPHSRRHYYTTTITTGNTGWWLNLGPTDWSSCFPTSYETNTEFYYSPGVCPSGYWAAGQGVSTIDANEEETHATCCPNNYIVQTESPTLDWQKTNLCSSRNTHSTVWYYTQGGTTTSLTTTADGINAKGISIRWRSADFAAQSTSASASDTPATATATATATGTSTNPADDSTQSSGLSTGAKAGIAIGVAVGAIAIITVLALLWMRRRKERLNAQVDRPAPQSPQPRELDGSHAFQEMPSGRLPAELGPEPEIKPHYVSELPTGRD
ncbi:uncharacterized protein N7484_002191 [Penicillium longicatenatum]|uniref:uncharacterized protein n=1 Tax=Penicillium longicatenatum TaxID=1561947 RepID=UPI002547A3CE|nr:uncharacterized protein N7484_002191 [Penicillium longicatenatum]KAJ5658542.1 hypothetical protein N7484_002191 [Penicillium longicatenatum]